VYWLLWLTTPLFDAKEVPPVKRTEEEEEEHPLVIKTFSGVLDEYRSSSSSS
jgi:hypothetical protein